MAQFFTIHPVHPQPRLINQSVKILREGGVIVYPTDSCYALACDSSNKQAIAKLRRVRKLSEKHHLSFVCEDLSHIGKLAVMDNVAFRLIKSLVPGPYTFILPLSRHCRKGLWSKRKTIGFRVPAHPIDRAILHEFQQPLVSSSLILPDEEFPMTDPWEFRKHLQHHVELIIDGGIGANEASTVIEWISDIPYVTRLGCGDIMHIDIELKQS